MKTVFGRGSYDYYNPLEGYKEPEWYWEGPNNIVFGVGFKHNIPRLRGKNINNLKYLTPEEAGTVFLSQVLQKIRLKI